MLVALTTSSLIVSAGWSGPCKRMSQSSRVPSAWAAMNTPGPVVGVEETGRLERALQVVVPKAQDDRRAYQAICVQHQNDPHQETKPVCVSCSAQAPET